MNHQNQGKYNTFERVAKPDINYKKNKRNTDNVTSVRNAQE